MTPGGIIHVLIGINSNECYKKFISFLPSIFPNTDPEIELHLCIMGHKPYELRPYIPESISTKIEIEAPAFNYSLTINTLLKQIEADYPTAIVGILDGWSIISMAQIITNECDKIDWNNEFININTLFDDINEPFSLDDVKIHSSYFARMSSRSFKRTNPKSFSPIIIGKINHIVDLECGLEEELFSEYSRLHLSNQLKTAGLKKIIPKKNVGLCIRNRQVLNTVENRDMEKILEMKKKLGYSIFIPSNYDVSWGDASKIGFLRVSRRGLPEWKYPYKVKNAKLLKIDNDGSKIKTEERINSSITEVIIQNNEFFINKQYKTLIMVSSYVRDLVSATPLIKEIYKKYGPPDILTNDKLLPTNSLIRNFMVNKIYDPSDFTNNRYLEYGTNIIKTSGCDIKYPSNIEVIEPLNIGNNLAEINYSVIDPCIKSIPDPYCSFEPMKRSVPPNTITIAISTQITSRSNTSWDGLGILCSRLANNTNTQILLISLAAEKKRLLTDAYKVRKNIHVFDSVSYTVAAGIINSASLFITPCESCMSWMCWGLKKNSIILNIKGFEVLESNYITNITIANTTNRNILPIDDIITNVVNKI